MKISNMYLILLFSLASISCSNSSNNSDVQTSGINSTTSVSTVDDYIFLSDSEKKELSSSEIKKYESEIYGTLGISQKDDFRLTFNFSSGKRQVLITAWNTKSKTIEAAATKFPGDGSEFELLEPKTGEDSLCGRTVSLYNGSRCGGDSFTIECSEPARKNNNFDQPQVALGLCGTSTTIEAPAIIASTTNSDIDSSVIKEDAQINNPGSSEVDKNDQCYIEEPANGFSEDDRTACIFGPKDEREMRRSCAFNVERGCYTLGT